MIPFFVAFINKSRHFHLTTYLPRNFHLHLLRAWRTTIIHFTVKIKKESEAEPDLSFFLPVLAFAFQGFDFFVCFRHCKIVNDDETSQSHDLLPFPIFTTTLLWPFLLAVAGGVVVSSRWFPNSAASQEFPAHRHEWESQKLGSELRSQSL